jgi:hypothetical protein
MVNKSGNIAKQCLEKASLAKIPTSSDRQAVAAAGVFAQLETPAGRIQFEDKRISFDNDRYRSKAVMFRDDDNPLVRHGKAFTVFIRVACRDKRRESDLWETDVT